MKLKQIFNKLFPCKWGKCNKPFGCTCGTFIGLSAGAIGTAALLGGGAYALSQSGKKKKKTEVPTYQGQRPYSTLKDIPEISGQYLPTLTDRLGGRGVGFREAELSAATSPYAAERRANLAQQTIPQISAQASARGLGRSTIPVNRIALASGEAERDIGQRIADLRLANEQQRRLEINNALASIGQFGQAEAATKAQAAGFDLGEFQQARGMNVQGDQFAQQMQQQDFQNLLGLGTLGVSAGTLAGKLQGTGGFTAPKSIFGNIPGVIPGTGSKVNIAGMDVDPEELAIIKQLLK